MLLDAAKHLYDLTTMIDQGRIQALLSTPENLVKMLAYKRREERTNRKRPCGKAVFRFPAVRENKHCLGWMSILE